MFKKPSTKLPTLEDIIRGERPIADAAKWRTPLIKMYFKFDELNWVDSGYNLQVTRGKFTAKIAGDYRSDFDLMKELSDELTKLEEHERLSNLVKEANKKK